MIKKWFRNKRRTRNAENLINAAAFNQINTVNTWIKTKWKNHSSVKTKAVGNTRLLLHAKMLLFPINFFLWRVDYTTGGKRFDWANVISYLVRSWHAYWFSAAVVSGRHDLPFDTRAFPLTFFEMQCSSLRPNRCFRLFNFLHLDPNNYKRFSFSPWMWRFSTMFCHAITTAYLAFKFLITMVRFLVTVSSKGITNEYAYKRQYNHSQHVHEL